MFSNAEKLIMEFYEIQGLGINLLKCLYTIKAIMIFNLTIEFRRSKIAQKRIQQNLKNNDISNNEDIENMINKLIKQRRKAKVSKLGKI